MILNESPELMKYLKEDEKINPTVSLDSPNDNIYRFLSNGNMDEIKSVLYSYGVSLKDDLGKYRSIYDILCDLAVAMK